jgi:hypothetical protein
MTKIIDEYLRYINALLKKKGFQKEYLMLKKAVPLIDISPLPLDEDDDKKDILFMKENPSQWYKSLSELGNDVILIPFDGKKLNKDVFQKLMYIWGDKIDERSDYTDKEVLRQDYADFSRNKSIVGLGSKQKVGSLERLKEVFPDLWNNISKKLTEMKKEPRDVVYIIYNEDKAGKHNLMEFIEPPEKSPRYLGHDLYHLEEDIYNDQKVDEIIYDFIAHALNLYIDESYLNKESKYIYEDYYDENGDIIEEIFEKNKKYNSLYYIKFIENFKAKVPPEEKRKMIVSSIYYFFDSLFSELEDYQGDILSFALSGEIRSLYKRPDSISTYLGTFIFDSTKESEMAKIEEKFFSDLMTYIKDIYRGPLSQTKGGVLFYDL